jgi:molybdate transport system permease protein
MVWDSIVLNALWLTFELAGLTTLCLLLVATPIAWWLSRTHNKWRHPIKALVTLPLVLPPTVLGFYLLILMGPNGPIGVLTQAIGIGTLPFTFSGLLVASVFYSLPFAVQPLQNTFEAIPPSTLESAYTLRASPWDTFFSVVLPLSRQGFFLATVLSFAHTVGEFGIVLMIGGNIPGKTQVVSTQIYSFVESMDYSRANALASVLLVFSFLVLLAMSLLGRDNKSIFR